MDEKNLPESDFIEIYTKALLAGEEALNKCVPVPMVVQQHQNMIDDKSPVVQEWFVSDGACGFAWVRIPAKLSINKKFIKTINEKFGNVLSRDTYNGGYCYWVHSGNQSITKKEEFAHAFAQVLSDNGIKCYANSRLD